MRPMNTLKQSAWAPDGLFKKCLVHGFSQFLRPVFGIFHICKIAFNGEGSFSARYRNSNNVRLWGQRNRFPTGKNNFPLMVP